VSEAGQRAEETGQWTVNRR
jgi:hypothetical protein